MIVNVIHFFDITFSNNDFTDFFKQDVSSMKDEEGNYVFKLIEHKLLDITSVDVT